VPAARSESDDAALRAELERRGLTVAAEQIARDGAVFRVNDVARAQLATIASEAWLVEPDVSLGGVRLSVLVLGPSGVYLVMARDGWRMEDIALAEPAKAAAAAMLGGEVTVRLVFFNPYNSENSYHCDASGRLVYVVGAGAFTEWLHEQPGCGLGTRRIAAIREAALPRPRPTNTVLAPHQFRRDRPPRG
jgi:hypothetical protein